MATQTLNPPFWQNPATNTACAVATLGPLAVKWVLHLLLPPRLALSDCRLRKWEKILRKPRATGYVNNLVPQTRDFSWNCAADQRCRLAEGSARHRETYNPKPSSRRLSRPIRILSCHQGAQRTTPRPEEREKYQTHEIYSPR